MPGIEDGITRLYVLAAGVIEGVFAAGVFRVELVPDRVLLRERLDEDGDTGTLAEAIESTSVLMKPPLSFALSRRARNLCSLTKVVFLLVESAVARRRGAQVVAKTSCAVEGPL